MNTVNIEEAIQMLKFFIYINKGLVYLKGINLIIIFIICLLYSYFNLYICITLKKNIYIGHKYNDFLKFYFSVIVQTVLIFITV